MEIRAKITLAVEQFKTGASIVGGLWKGMTVDAQKHTANVDKYLQKNLANQKSTSDAGKIHDMRNLTDFEKQMISSRRRIAKEAMKSQMTLPDTKQAHTDWLKTNMVQPKPKIQVTDITARKNAERDYTKWWQNELNKRDQMQFWNSSKVQRQLTRNDKQMWKGLLKDKAAIAADAARAERTLALNALKTRLSDGMKHSGQMAKAYIKDAKVQSDWKIAQFRRELDYRIMFDQQAKKSSRANLSSEEFNKSLSRTRYALYDIGTKLAGFGMAIAGAFGQAIMKSAEFESAFTRVERTSGVAGPELEKLKKSLMDIATISPVSYEDITKVATLGAQMGIAADSLNSFTNTVVQFSAITGVAVETVAQSFGRLGQLLDVPSSKFENLSSAITYVGVNAVATDAEILAMSESISAAANQAGFAADEVIGLSGALASLKVRPEEARGVIVRLFRTIDSSVSAGGQQLDDFAKIMGITAEEAKKLWKQDPSQFFSSFLVGAKNTGDLNNAISSLGITNSRELNVIQRLANNTDVLASTMKDAHEQYLLGTYAGDAYGKVQDDLASKMTIFQNVVEQLQASFGETFMGPMKVFMDILISVGKVMSNLPGPVKLVISLVAGIVAGMLIFKGTMLLAVAGMLALKTAMNGLGISSVRSIASLSTLRSVMGTVGVGGAKAGTMMRFLSFGLLNVDRSAKIAAMGTRLLSGSMMLLQKAAPILMILSTVAVVAFSVAEAMGNASNSASKLGDAMIEAGGGSEELRKAMALDNEHFKKTGESLGKLTFKYNEGMVAKRNSVIQDLAVAESADAVVTGIQNSEIAHGRLTDATSIAQDANQRYNDTISEQNNLLGIQEIALGKNTAAFVANALAKYGENQDKNLYKDLLAPKNQDWMKEAEKFGFNIADMISAGMNKEGGATAYLNEIEDSMYNVMLVQDQVVGDPIATEVKRLGAQYGWTAEKIATVTANVKASHIAMGTTETSIMDAAGAIDEMRVSMIEAAAAAEIQTQTLIDQGYSADEAADMVSGLTEELKKYLETSLKMVNANSGVLGSFYSLSQGLRETGNNMDIFTADGRTNMSNWSSFMQASLDAASAAGEGFNGGVERISAGLHMLASQGVDTGAAFSTMRDYIANAASGSQYGDLATNLRNATDTTDMQRMINAWVNTQDATTEAGQAAITYGRTLRDALNGGGYATQFLQQWNQTQVAAKNTKKEVKTLIDYANELGGVLKQALEIRFAKTNGLIGLKNTMFDINKGLKDAKKNILDLQKTMSENANNKNQLVTDLQLAVQFGDTAGAARIRDEMASLDAEIAQNASDIAYNQGIASGSMDLNTQAGRDNVKTVQDLISSNVDYIEGLVKSGASQTVVTNAVKDSKAAFEKQLAAMGLSGAEIKKQSKIFDGFITIIKKVPKDVTVGANTDPAKLALANFIARVNASKADVTIGVITPSKEERLAALKAEKVRLTAERTKLGVSPALAGTRSYYTDKIASIDALIKSGNYAMGGLITGSGSGTSDSITIGASNGEFMMSAASVSRYGVDFMSALNQQRVGMGMPSGVMSGVSNSSSQVVYLSSRDRQLLEAAINRPVTLRTSNKIIAQAANDGNIELAKRGRN